MILYCFLLPTHKKLGSRDRVICGGTRVKAGWPRISESVPVRDKRCFSIPDRPDWFWTTSVSLSNIIGADFPGVKLPWPVNGHSLLSTVKVTNESIYTSIFSIRFLVVQGQIFTHHHLPCLLCFRGYKPL
jgi:hypothetical protein